MPPTVSVATPSAPLKADVVVVGVRRTSDGPQLVSGAETIDKQLGGRLLAALRSLGATGRVDEVLKIPTLGLTDVPLVVGTGCRRRRDRRRVGAPRCRRRAAHAR